MTEIAKDRPAKKDVPEIPLKKLRQLWSTQRPTEEIAIYFKVSLAYLYSFAKRHDLPRRTHVARRRPESVEPDPTPEEIALRAAEVRARWTTEEYTRNCCYKPKRVEMQTYSFDGRFVAFNEIHRDV